MADDAGALLVRSGLITAEALELSRALVQSEGGCLGEHLVAGGVLTDDALTEFYRTRLLVPQVNPNTLARLPEQVVSAIPADLAIELRVIPVALGEGITIAMGDPSSRIAVDEVSAITSTYVIRSVATQMQIAWCLAHYYGHVTPLGRRLVQGSGDGASTPSPEIPAAAPPRRARGLTSKVNAARHRARPPITSQVEILRPDPALLDDPTPEPPPVIEIQADEPDDDGPEVTVEQGEEPEAAPRSGGASAPARSAISALASGTVRSAGERDAADAPLPSSRVRTLTGEIALSAGRKATVRPDEPDDGPVVTIEVSDALLPKRRAANWQDPPELASRTGELQSRHDTLHSHHEEPAVVIADDLDEEALAKARANRLAQLNASVEVQVQEDVAIVTSQPAHGAVAEPLDDSDSAPILLQPKRPTVETRAAAPVRPGTPKPAVPQAVDPDEASGAVVLLGQPKAQQSSRPSTQLSAAAAPAAPAAPTAPAAPVLPSVLSSPSPSPGKPPATAADARRQRPERRTQLGLGIDASTSLTSLPSFSTLTATAPSPTSPSSPSSPKPGGRAARDTEVTISSPDQLVPPDSPEAAASPGPLDHTELAARYEDDDDDEPTSTAAAYPDDDAPEAPDGADEAGGAARPSARAAARSYAYSQVDDGWGPPGSTIPPPWLGAIPGGIDADADAVPGAVIPISDESGPLLIAPPSPPQGSGRGSAKVAVPNTEDLVAELEIATGLVVELVRRLDQAVDRDQIIDLLVHHLADSHQRAGFLTIRQGVLTAFRISPTPLTLSPASLKLDGPSTLQDVVDTQLPYRGPLADESSRQFIGALLDDVPAEILLVPISVRERVVGVLFAERRKRHTFDEQLAVASRAAGVAFERVVRARRER